MTRLSVDQGNREADGYKQLEEGETNKDHFNTLAGIRMDSPVENLDQLTLALENDSFFWWDAYQLAKKVTAKALKQLFKLLSKKQSF